MSKYRKKPLIIEATQWFSGKDVKGVLLAARMKMDGTRDVAPYVTTIHGQVTWISEGDWVITEPGENNGHYPCKDEVFKATYEPVEE